MSSPNDKPLCDLCNCAHYDFESLHVEGRFQRVCRDCVPTIPTEPAPLDPVTLASQSMPRPMGGLAADLWDMFANTHRPTMTGGRPSDYGETSEANDGNLWRDYGQVT